MVDQTGNMHGTSAASADTSHVQDMGAYSKAWVADVLQQGCYHSLFSRFSPLFLNNTII